MFSYSNRKAAGSAASAVKQQQFVQHQQQQQQLKVVVFTPKIMHFMLCRCTPQCTLRQAW